jgi:hypothetical protein
LAQLRILAASYSTFASDLKRQMVRSAFLLASKRVVQSADKPSTELNLLEEDEDATALLEYDLAAAKEVGAPAMPILGN